jgi:hypothetical protein
MYYLSVILYFLKIIDAFQLELRKHLTPSLKKDLNDIIIIVDSENLTSYEKFDKVKSQLKEKYPNFKNWFLDTLIQMTLAKIRTNDSESPVNKNGTTV